MRIQSEQFANGFLACATINAVMVLMVGIVFLLIQ